MTTYTGNNITFPKFAGLRCLMMPYIQGEPDSVPDEYGSYRGILSNTFVSKGSIGYLTIDESMVVAGKPHRGARAKHGRALHTEVGVSPEGLFCWGYQPPRWGGSPKVTLDKDVKIILSNNLDHSCAVWEDEVFNTSEDGDIGYLSGKFPYESAILMKAGEVHCISPFNPHESLPVKETVNRQFLRIVSDGVHGREEYFTENPRMM